MDILFGKRLDLGSHLAYDPDPQYHILDQVLALGAPHGVSGIGRRFDGGLQYLPDLFRIVLQLLDFHQVG